MSNDTFQEMDPRISFVPNTCLIYKELNLNKNDSEIKWLGLTIGFLYKHWSLYPVVFIAKLYCNYI